MLAGAAGMVLSALAPWVTIHGLRLDLGVIGAEVSPRTQQTVHGTDTSIWPAILVVAAVVALLAAIGVARRVLIAIGLIVIACGGALLYYVANVIDIETSGKDPITQTLAHLVISSSTGPGPPLLLASGIAIVAGALLAE
jgi:hypothetical protein